MNACLKCEILGLHSNTLPNIGINVPASARVNEAKYYSIKNLSQKINRKEPSNVLINGTIGMNYIIYSSYLCS